MTRNDYEKVAAAIRVELGNWPERGTHWHMAYAIASELAHVMAQDNPRFNRALFLSACGFPLELESNYQANKASVAVGKQRAYMGKE